MNEFIPGDPANATEPEGIEAYRLLEQSVVDAEAVIDETDASIILPIITEIKEAESVCQYIEGICAGEIGVAVDDAEKLIDKIKGKVQKNIDNLLTDAYIYMGQLGIPVPTEEDLAYAEATGDTLSGLGFVPPDRTLESTLDNSEQGRIEADGENATAENAPERQPQPSVNGGLPSIPSESKPEPVPFPQPTQPATCPPGYRPAVPESTVISSFQGTSLANPQLQRAGGTQNCDPPINGGWTNQYPAQSFIAPWGGGVQEPSLVAPSNQVVITDKICFDGCHLRPPYMGGVCFYYPKGWEVWIDPTDGRIVAAQNRPSWGVSLRSYLAKGQNVEPDVPPAGQVPGCVPDDNKPAACPPPDKLCGPDADWANFPSDNKKEDVCEQITEAIKALEGTTLDLTKIMVVATGANQGSWITDAIINAITGGNEPIIGGLFRRFAAWMQKTVTDITNKSACDSPAALASGLRMAFLRLIDKYTDMIPDQAIRSGEQISNTICQSILPDGASADEMFLSDEIKEPEWECYQKAEGNHLDPAKKKLHSKRNRVNAVEADRLYRRKKIDWEEMRKRMRAAGVLEDDDLFDIRALQEHWPTASDLVSWMKRDAFDEKEAEQAKLDEDFEKKFTGKAEDYADGIGMSKDEFKYHWRAHWQLPSYTMAREFLYRFNDEDTPENLRFDENRMRTLLKQDDWAPGYVDLMIQAAYHPVTRSDAVKAYMIHAVNDDEFIKLLIKTGYDKKTSEFYKEYYKKRRAINDRKASGYPTMRTAVNAYARCELAPSEFQEIVKDIAIDNEQERAAIKAAKTARKMRERQQAIRTIKKPFILGIYDDAQTQTELANNDVEPSCVSNLLENWRRERMRRDKYLSASQLCQMMERGVIDARTMVMALVRSGWDDESAVMIATNCGLQISEKMANKARAEGERQQRELKKLQREQEKAKRLAECGPPPCPANRQQSNRPVLADQ